MPIKKSLGTSDLLRRKLYEQGPEGSPATAVRNSISNEIKQQAHTNLESHSLYELVLFTNKESLCLSRMMPA